MYKVIRPLMNIYVDVYIYNDTCIYIYIYNYANIVMHNDQRMTSRFVGWQFTVLPS